MYCYVLSLESPCGRLAHPIWRQLMGILLNNKQKKSHTWWSDSRLRLDASVVEWEEEEEGEDSLRMGLDTLVVGGGFSRSVQPIATAGESVFLTFTWWSEL